jgi:putative transcriptional regulator
VARQVKGSRVGDDLVEAFQEMAAYLRGEAEAESYELDKDILTPVRIKRIRQKVASSTKEFERRFHVPARTMEAYEQGRRRPDAAMATLLRVIDREPDAVRRALASTAPGELA